MTEVENAIKFFELEHRTLKIHNQQSKKKKRE
jgi:hypothetical protein